jgi:hypothetical protein
MGQAEGYAFVIISVLFFGSNFVVTKKYKTGDGTALAARVQFWRQILVGRHAYNPGACRAALWSLLLCCIFVGDGGSAVLCIVLGFLVIPCNRRLLVESEPVGECAIAVMHPCVQDFTSNGSCARLSWLQGWW